MSDKIRSISIVTAQGASSHYVGNENVHAIAEEDLLIDGNPYMHYVGRDDKGKILFKISGISPVEVIYERPNN